MKTLQNDLTTIEQSKRLLELGVPKNSANHYYGKDGKIHYIDGTIPYSLLWETGCTPCWSVGRLMEIYEICSGKKYERKSARLVREGNVSVMKELTILRM